MPDLPPPETLAWLRHAASCGKADAQLTLHILERLEALERKYETQRLATLEWGKDVDKLMRWIDDHLKRIMALEAAQQQPHQDKLDRLIALDQENEAPAPEPAPPAAANPANAAPLLWILWNHQGSGSPEGQAIRKYLGIGRFDRMTADQLKAAKNYAMGQPPAAQPAPPAAPAGGLVERVDRAIIRAWADCGPKGEARAAIREVAAWLRERGYRAAPADLLEQEAG